MDIGIKEAFVCYSKEITERICWENQELLLVYFPPAALESLY